MPASSTPCQRHTRGSALISVPSSLRLVARHDLASVGASRPTRAMLQVTSRCYSITFFDASNARPDTVDSRFGWFGPNRALWGCSLCRFARG